MYCVECGTKNPDDAKFCKQCGRRMEALGPAGSAPAEAPPAEPTRPAQAPDPEARYKELLALGFRHYDHAEYDAAALAVMSALEVRPDSTDAHALLSTIYERLGDREKAIAERERVLQLNPASIADREKLEALRSGIAQVAPRKILSSHRPDPTFWDTPAGAAAAAGIVTVVVVVIGYAVTLYRDRAQGPAPLIQPGTAVTSAQGRPAVADPNPAMLSGSGGQQNQTPTQAGQNPQSAGPAPQTRLPEGQPTGMVEPLPVRPTPPALGQDTGTADRDGRSGGFFDPGREGSNTQPNPPSGSGSPPVGPTTNPGRIEIVVSPQGGTGTAPPVNVQPGGANMESRNHATIAFDLQMKQDYKRAAQAWERALEGAGDDAPGLHQKAAICYQRTGDAASARRHYNDAIRGYRDHVVAGRNVEAATQAIKACEAGLAATR